MRGNCPNCGAFLGRTTGESSIYNPGKGPIILCEECWLDEDDLIEQEGANSPEHSEAIRARLERYRANGA